MVKKRLSRVVNGEEMYREFELERQKERTRCRWKDIEGREV